MNNNLTHGDVPLGFGMALAQNTDALNSFAKLTEEERKVIINGAHNVKSRQEMRDYVNNIIKM